MHFYALEGGIKIKHKIILTLVILFVILLAASTVSATDNVTDEAVVSTNDDVSNDVIDDTELQLIDEDQSIDDNLLSINEEDILSASHGTFTDLANDIENATGELNLTKDYIYNSSSDSSYYGTGLRINKKIIINGNGFSIDGNNGARAFKINFDNVFLYNITFKNCYYSYDGGGAIYWNGTNGTLNNCKFINCYFESSSRYSSSYGGAIYWNGNNGTIKKCKFEDCCSQSEYGYSDGGAIYLSGMGCILDNCIFNQCNVKGSSLSESTYGGAVYINGVKNSISNCEFNKCYAKSIKRYISSYGGAIYWNANDGYLDNCTFNKCEAITQYSSYSYGGSICWLGINGTVLNSKFNNCSSLYIGYDNSGYYTFSESDNGGAIAWLGDNGILKNNNFTNCYSKSTSSCGGAVYWEGNYGMLGDNIFKNCSANSGGAICWQGLNGTSYNNTFEHCFSTCEIISGYAATSLSYGGAIYWNGNNGIVSKSKFNECYSKSHCDSYKTSTAHTLGGAIYWNGNNGNLNNCTFHKCYANASSIYQLTNLCSEGGTIYWNGVDGSLTQNVFNSCISRESEIIYCNGINCKLTNCNFTNASNNYVIKWNALNGTLNNCNFVNQTICWQGANGLLDNCNFANCSSKNGGAIYYTSNDCIITNCVFVNCSTTEYGGAIYLDYMNCILSNCKFINCYSKYGGAIYCKNNNNTLDNCAFINCSSNQGGAVNWVGNNGILIHNNFTNCFTNNPDDDAYGSAIYLKGNNCMLNDCIFRNLFHYPSLEYSSFGSIYWQGDNGILANCSFNNCSSINAATIYWRGVNSNLINCNIINCSAHDSICKIYSEGNITNFKIKNSFSKNGLILDKSSNFIIQNLMIDYMDELGDKFSNLTDNTVINLKQNYTSKSTILIYSNNITINGNGHSIDANNLRLFDIQCNNITIKNTKILNSEGIDFYGNGFTLINCTFINGSTNKTFLSIHDDFYHMINCNFENCSSKWHLIELYCINSTISGCNVTNCFSDFGIGLYGDYGIISNCDFNFINTKLQIKLNGFNYITNCTFNNASISSNKANTRITNCKFNNGTISLSGNNTLMYGCNFTSTGLNWGGSGTNGTIQNCRFVNSHRNYGGAILWGGNYGMIVNCSFINNTAIYGGAICMDGTNGTIINSTFINNTAIKGNNIYIDGYTKNNGLYQEDILKNNFIDGGIYTEIKSITPIVKINSIYFSLPDVKNAKLDIYFKNGTYYQIDIINGTAILTLPFGSYEINASLNNSNYSLINTGYKNYVLEDTLNGLFSNVKKDSIINLYRDFNFDKDIEISSNGVVVDGNGFTLDFTESSNSFILSGKNIILKNINFIGANTTNTKGIIRCEEESTVYIINCTFINKGNSNYISIYSVGDILQTIKCTFINNTFNKRGSCIYLPNYVDTYLFSADDCTFINCSSTTGAGAISGCCNMIINRCTFVNCTGGSVGAISFGSDGRYLSATISKSTFINCYGNNCGSIGLSEMIANITYNCFINTVNSSINEIRIFDCNDSTNIEYNWWGNNQGPSNRTIQCTYDKNYTIEKWIILNSTITPLNYSNDCIALISTYFLGYDNTTGTTVNLTSDIVRPAKYELSNGFVSANSTGDVIFDCNKVGYYPVSINITVDNQVISKTFYVFKKVTPLVNVSISDCVENKSKIFMIKTTNDLTNNFTITITGENGYMQTVSNITLNSGSYTKEFKNLLPSNYTIYVKYGGDEGYYPIEKNITFKVTKFDPSYSVNVTNTLFKQNATIVVSIPITGNVTINIGNITIFDNIVIDNGKVVKNVSNLDAGNYLIEITYNGNEYYNTLTQFVNLTIAKASSAIKVYVNDSKYGEDTIINVTSDITCQLFVKINNTIKDINVTANELQSINFGKLNASNYTVIVSFDGDKNYNNASLTKEFNVSKINASLIIQKEDVNVDETVNISILLPNDATGSVKVTLGNNETIIPITNPIVYWKFTPTKGGNHTVKVEYLGDNNYFTNKTNFTLIVKKLNPTISCNGTEVIVPNEPYQITVNLPDDATGKVIINLDKNNYTIENITTAKTITIPKINEGSYNCTIYYSGDDKYKSYNDTRQILVNINRNVKISASDITTTNKNGKFELTLLDAKNNPLSSELIIVYIDTDEYDVTTNKNGTATVYYGLNSGEHKVNVYFNSTDTYNPLKTTFKITIKSEINNDQITIPSLSSGSGAVKLPSDAKGTITLDIAGKKYDFSVVNGVANIKLPDLASGSYGYIITYSGDARYTSFSKTGSVTVNKQTTPAKPVTKTTLTLKKVTVKRSAKKLTIQATLKINGKAVKGKWIKFKFNKKTYKAKTNVKGIAKVTVKKAVLKKLKKGKKVTYTATYSKITKKVIVKVKK